MQKRILCLLGIFTQLLSASLFANSNPDVKLSNSLLWKVSGNGLQKPSFIFGTIHAICQDDYFFNRKMKEAFAQSEKLILEINLADPSSLAQYEQSMLLPDGRELKDYFSSAGEFNNFSEKLKARTGIDVELFSRFKPLVLLSLIAQSGFSCSVTASYESKLLEMGREKAMPVDGLETALSQMKIFDDMTDTEIRNILLDGIEELEEDNKLQKQLVLQYKNENIDSLHELIVSSGEFKQHEKALITDRNISWSEKLPAMMQERSGFVAVGAGHLSGERGLIRLLQKKGYRVEPVFD